MIDYVHPDILPMRGDAAPEPAEVAHRPFAKETLSPIMHQLKRSRLAVRTDYARSFFPSTQNSQATNSEASLFGFIHDGCCTPPSKK